ncbi:MAG: alkaline phosphatase family protein, partial [Flavobacterium sp.]|nr:alkaline phosphatase family protein [Pedobacter sp.]
QSTQWISNASMLTDDLYNPTLTMIYLPHLDYCLQKYGPDLTKISSELLEIDQVLENLVEFYQRKEAKIILLSEYGIAPVNIPVHLNRVLRKAGLLEVRVERGLELLDAGASKAFVVSDHQIAHVYINDPSVTEQVKEILKSVSGIELILDHDAQAEHHINHQRAGDLVLIARENCWFTYYFWLDDTKAPDYARMVDIHKKPGYDPVEMFMTSKLRAGYKLLRKKAGFRYVMDVIPLDATLIKGSHGRVDIPEKYYPVLITDENNPQIIIQPTEVYDVIWRHLFS